MKHCLQCQSNGRTQTRSIFKLIPFTNKIRTVSCTCFLRDSNLLFLSLWQFSALFLRFSGKMTELKEYFCGVRLRTLCMIIGYLHLASSVADIAYHLLTVAIVTNGFQCDVNADKLAAVTSIPLLEPLLLVLNLGTHGFYPFPRIIRSQYSIYVEYMAVPSVTRCYPGMLHVYLVDVLNFFINLIWLRIVTSYIGALHQRNPEPMRMFFSLSIVKLVMQVMYLGYQPQFYNTVDFETYWFLKLLDILIAVFFLIIVRKYTHYLKAELLSQRIEKPPPYIECLIGSFSLPKEDTENYEKKEAVIDVEENKDETKPNEEPKTTAKDNSIYLTE